MFLSINKLPNEIPLLDRPDPKAAQALQEGLGGQFGEGEQWCNIYFRIWTLEDAKPYKDLLRSVATEEIGHAELVANTIKILLKGERTVFHYLLFYNNNWKVVAFLYSLFLLLAVLFDTALSSLFPIEQTDILATEAKIKIQYTLFPT